LFSRHQTETATDDAVTLRRHSRCKRSRLFCVVGCLAKPVCFSKYCNIKRLPSTAALLAIPVGLHRVRQRAANLTPTSLMPAPTHVRIFRDLNENATNLSSPLTAWQGSWLRDCCFCCFYYRGMIGDQTTNARPVPTASYHEKPVASQH